MKRFDRERAEGAATIATRTHLTDASADANATRTRVMDHTRLRDDLAEERAHDAALADRLRELSRAADVEARRVDALIAAMRTGYGSSLRGSAYDTILRAALDVTHTDRGCYVTMRDDALITMAAAGDAAVAGDAPPARITDIVRHLIAGEPASGTRVARVRNGLAAVVRTQERADGVLVLFGPRDTFGDAEMRSLRSVCDEAAIAVDIARLRNEVQDAYVATISLLADAVQAKDAYTHGHCERVSQYARATAELLGLSVEEKRITCYAALLHDVGKIGVSDGVLNKPGPLVDEERLLVQAHVRIGHDLLTGVPALRDVAHAVLHHHEWFDGRGYPAGLAGSEIPVASRIVAAIDAYCAMIDERAYKHAYTPEHAREELRRCAGTQFDPGVIDAVLHAIDLVDRDGSPPSAISDSCGLLPDRLAG